MLIIRHWSRLANAAIHTRSTQLTAVAAQPHNRSLMVANGSQFVVLRELHVQFRTHSTQNCSTHMYLYIHSYTCVYDEFITILTILMRNVYSSHSLNYLAYVLLFGAQRCDAILQTMQMNTNLLLYALSINENQARCLIRAYGME